MFWSNKKDIRISEIYMLVHPFWRSGADYDRYCEIWCESIRKASEDKNTYAFIDLPHEAYADIEKEKIILDAVGKCFKNRFALQRDGLEFRTGSPLLKDIFSVLRRSENGRITARGVYTQRCVIAGISDAAKRSGIPQANCFINLEESVDSGYSLSEERESLEQMRTSKKIVSLQEMRKWNGEITRLIEQRYNL